MFVRLARQPVTATKEPSNANAAATGWIDVPTEEYAIRVFTLNLRSLHR